MISDMLDAEAGQKKQKVISCSFSMTLEDHKGSTMRSMQSLSTGGVDKAALF